MCGISCNCWDKKLILKKFLPGHLEEKKRVIGEWTWGKDNGALKSGKGRGRWSPEEYKTVKDDGALKNR